MFGSIVLEVAIGVVFVYLLLSLICSAVREGIEARLKTRALYLERGIQEFLRDPAKNNPVLAQKLYEHPLVYSLYPGEYVASTESRGEHTGLSSLWATIKSWWWGAKPTNLPSYIPARNFALALLDLAGRGEPGAATQKEANAGAPLTVAAIRANVGQLVNPYVQRAVLTALDTSKDDLELAIKSLEKWYDSGMDRVSGWYKRETQRILFMVGLIVVVALNVDTIAIVKNLAIDKTAREALVVAAETAVKDKSVIADVEKERRKASLPDVSPPGSPKPEVSKTPVAAPAGEQSTTSAVKPPAAGQPATPAPGVKPPEAKSPSSSEDQINNDIKTADQKVKLLKKELYGLNLPIGWGELRSDACPQNPVGEESTQSCVWPYDFVLVLLSIPGWLITAFAVSFGAPFWFDLLNKIMVIRSTVKPHEKSPEESSEDRQKPAPPANNPGPLGEAPGQLPKPG